MSVVDQLVARLSQTGLDGSNVVVAVGGDQFLLRVDRSGPLAVSCWELKFSTGRLAGAPIERVREVADEVTRRVTYLLEPIQPIESDSEACVVQLRSTEPQADADGVRTYYEALARTGGSVSLQRYEAPRGALRASVAMTLTREIVGRLAADFLASVS